MHNETNYLNSTMSMNLKIKQYTQIISASLKKRYKVKQRNEKKKDLKRRP